LEDITEKFIEKILDMVNQNVQDAPKKFQDNKIKDMRTHRKKIKKLREEFNKHQSKTKVTIKRDRDELKMTTQNIKEAFSEVSGKPQKKESNRNPGKKRSL
jgi:hypothetical protein